MSYQGQAGSYASIPVSVLRFFSPPPPEILGDPDLFRERIQTSTTGMLAILGIEASGNNISLKILDFSFGSTLLAWDFGCFVILLIF